MALGDKPAAGRHTVFVSTRDGRFAIGTLEKGRIEQFQVAYWLPAVVFTAKVAAYAMPSLSTNNAYFSHAQLFVELDEFPCCIARTCGGSY